VHTDDDENIMNPDDDETRIVRRAADDDDTRLVRRDADDDDDTRFVRHDVDVDVDVDVDDADTRFVRRDTGNAGSADDEPDETRVVGRRSLDREDDQTRVVGRHSIDETRVVENAVHANQEPVTPDSDDATRLSGRAPAAASDTDPERTQLSTRTPAGQPRQNAAPAFLPASAQQRTNVTGVPSGAAAGVLAGISHPPDAPLGSTATYSVRAPEPAAPIQRLTIDANHPTVELPASAEQIRRAASARSRRRSIVAIIVIVIASAAVAGVAIGAAVVISGL
jgi:hypothetical protein